MTGNKVSVTTIDSWTAESKPQNRIPGEYIPAFCEVTKSREPLVVINKSAGLFIIPRHEELRKKIDQLEENERLAKTERLKCELFLKCAENMEGDI